MNFITKLDESNILGYTAWGELASLKSIIMDITTRCNALCKYCNVDASHKNHKEMDLQFIKKIILQMGQLNIFELKISGGEPLLRKDIYEIIKYASEQGLSVWLLSNGALIDKSVAAKLKDSGLTGVRISIDSSRPYIHDKIRGVPGLWKKANDAIDLCNEVGLETVLGMTITKENIMDIHSTRELAIAKGSIFTTCILMPFGRAKEYIKEVGELNIEEIRLATQYSSGSKVCNAVNEVISIDVNGNICACTFAKPILSLSKMTLHEALGSKELTKYKYPIPESEKCKSCKVKTPKGTCIMRKICRGGCWAIYESELKKANLSCSDNMSL